MHRESRGARNSWRNRWRVIWRKKLRPIWRGIEWPVVGGGWILALVLGFIGFNKRMPLAGNEMWTGLDTLYRTLQLFIMESGSVAGPVPWQLEVARFLMPAVAGYAALQALLTIFREQWHRARLRVIKGHVVICGLGERGLRLTQDFLDRGFRVAVVEQDDENPLIDLCREHGSIVLVGDATDRGLLRRVGVRRAKYLISVCAEDGTNAEIALLARKLVRSRRGRPLSAFVHIEDLELCNFLGGGQLAAVEGEPIRIEFFNVLERGARLMLEEHPPFEQDDGGGGRRPRILVVGLGKMGRSLVTLAARDWWMRRAGDDRKLRIVVVDAAAETKLDLLRLQFPQLDEACEFDIRQLPRQTPEFERGGFLFDAEGRLDVDVIYFCFDDDVHVLVNALTLHRKTRHQGVPIVMRMSRDAGLATLLKEGRGGRDFAQLHVFGLLDRTCTVAALLGGRHEILARALHEDLVRHGREAGATPDTVPSKMGWDDLREDIKESRRDLADHIEAELRAIGCGLQFLTDWRAASYERLPEDVKAVFDVEHLARSEHDRWCEDRRRLGWSFAPGPEDLKKRTSPHLVSWEKLPPEAQSPYRDMVRGLPGLLAQAGYQIYRRS